MEINCKKDILRATEDEIKSFFDNSIFRGRFSAKSNEGTNLSWACGIIEDITINGQVYDFCPKSLLVPNKFSKFVKDGICEFKATLDIKSLRDSEKVSFKFIIFQIKNVNVIVPKRDDKQEKLFRYNLKLKNNRFVGQFTVNSDNSFTIRDIRRSDFSKLILQNGKAQAPIVYHPHLFKPQDGKYYEFSWILNGVREDYVYLFKVDETQPFNEVTPPDLIKRLHDDIMSYPAGAGQKIVKMLDTLKNQLTASGKEIFIYELLQNANDYPFKIGEEKQMVNVEFHLTLSSLIFMHSGAEFNERNIAAICSINDKEKDENKDAIGYKGIGFKTVFLDNDNVYLQTGGYSFRFDRQASKDIVDTPWQILPIWTKYNELSPAEKAIFTLADSEYRVKFALRPIKQSTLRDSTHNYEQMFREVFKNERVILFIPNLASVKIYLQGKPEADIVCSRSNDTWRVDDFEEEVNEATTEAINADINEQEDTGGLKIPTKYYDFKKTKVSFACEVDGKCLKPVQDTCLYCYLPAKEAKWGFKFLMNTDMIPNGSRDDIEVDFSNTINVNEEISKIAGSKFFDWIFKLCDSKQYELNSVFGLVPNFNTIKREHGKYKTLIDIFKEGFEERVSEDELIPTNEGYALVIDTILDDTGITSSGILSDEEFLHFTNNADKYLPVEELRGSKNLKSFLTASFENLDCEENIFNEDSLHELIKTEDFQEWLKNQDNNNKFLNFLLEKEYIEDFFDEEIFIEGECGKLFSASELYYDVDEEMKDLSAFSGHICYLSLQTREFFKDNEDWSDAIEDKFAEFDGESFICKILLKDNLNETLKALEEWETSFHFFSYLAKNDIVPDNLCDLPFFNDEEDAELIDNFDDYFVFFSSKRGKETCNSSWLSSVNFAFVSPNYDKDTLDYFKGNAGVRDFEDKIIVDEIILSDDYKDDINDSQQEDLETSVDFVKYCFEHKEMFETGYLRNFALNACDCNGEEDFVLYDAHLYFPSSTFDNYSEKEWLNSDWMYCLDSSYLSIGDDKNAIKKFLKHAFYVEELDDKAFYKDVVKNNIKDIIDNTSGSNDSDGSKNLDFVAYLDDNYKLIFEEEKDADRFEEFVFIKDNNDGSYSDIDSDETYIYAFNQELKEILESDWFPKDTVNMCSANYGSSRAITAIEAKTYDFGDFFDDVITEELSNINDTIDSKDTSIAFHNFIIERLKDLTDTQKEVMKGAKVYLYGSDVASERSEGHKILSKSARELAELGLVEFSDLDIIDPDYHIESNEDYWKSRLGNEQFTIIDFIKWLSDNKDNFYSTVEDRDNNINFWRWVKGCKLSDKTISELPVLPIFLDNDEYVDSDDTIYLSDDYIEEGGLETIVKNYNQDASFISADYIGDDEDINSWKDFWVKLGVRFEMVDILIDTIDNRLSETEDEKLPATLAKYRLKLDEYYEGKLISNLTDLKVKAHDGTFYSLSDVIYVDCEKEEPFTFIEFPNQVTFPTADERKLIMEIIDEIEGTKIERLVDWQAAKIDRYLEIQEDEDESATLLRSIHFKFVNELAGMYNEDRESLKDFDNIKDVLFLDEDEEFTSAEDLTEGSIYSPFCDFQRFELDYNYLSNSYHSQCENDVRKMLNRIFKIHCDFKTEIDIANLSNREFAIYFWKDYLTKRDADITGVKKLIEDFKFDTVACIPTKDYMKKPTEVYALSISPYVVKHVEDWENKLPLSSLPEIEYNKEENRTLFGLLLNKPSNLRLSFMDSLYALFSIAGQDRRSQLLSWMIETYDEKFDVNIDEYRADESALWKNTKNEDMQITNLYALSYGDKMLEQYFGTLPQIINKEYLPAGPISFKKACDILKIVTIEPEDLIIDPIGKVSRNDYYKRDMKIYALVISGFEDNADWQTNFEHYCERIDSINFWCCNAISLRYDNDEEICQKLKKFYHENGSDDFYFVKSLDEKRVFKPFVESFIEYLGIEAEKDFVETVMDCKDAALEIVQENNTLMLDEAFKDALDKLIPGIKRELNGNEANDTDFIEEGRRHVFTGHSESTEEDSNEDGIGNEEDCTQDPGEDISEEVEDTTPDDDQHIQNEGNSETVRLPRTDKGGTHNYPHGTVTRSTGGGNSNTPTSKYPTGEKVGNSQHPYSDLHGWNDTTRNTPLPPKPFSPEDVANFGSNGQQRSLDVLEPTQIEVDDINRILDGDLTAEQVADQNYLAQLRLYRNLQKRNMQPEESEADFVRNAHLKNEHTLQGGKYIHKCSAAGGIMYLSPSIWNKIADDRCVVCVYLGAKANDFMYFNSIDDILQWIKEDDIVIKLTGEEKADVVQELYSGVLEGVKGTAYTMIRIASNEKYNSIFAALPGDPNSQQKENEEEY